MMRSPTRNEAIPENLDRMLGTPIEKKITCPVMRTLHRIGKFGSGPLAWVASVKNFGDSGGGDLGVVLQFFAELNHAQIGPFGKPDLLFDLDFLHSPGQHLGSSGVVHTGKFNLEAWEWMFGDCMYKDYMSFGRLCFFIASNLRRDNAIEIPSLIDFIKLSFGLLSGKRRDKLRAFFARFPIVVCAGEWALMYALLENVQDIDLPKNSLSFWHLARLFVDREPFDGFETAPKYKSTWGYMAVKLFFRIRKELRKQCA